MKKVLQGWVSLFPLWVLAASGLAWFFPASFAALKPGIVPGLCIIMLGMGMTLTLGDFGRVLKQPFAVLCGLGLQFLIMPLLGLLLARLFHLGPELTLGFIILGSCPGGTASNVISYLARADVALSVTLTACSTVLAVFFTPLLVKLYGGGYLAVNAWAMLWDVFKIAFLPVAVGLFLNRRYQRQVEKILVLFPAVSVLLIVLIIATIIGAAHNQLPRVIGAVGVVVLLHNLGGMLLGYGCGRLLLLPERTCRTIAIEVGMQNSGLGVALSGSFASPLVALPASLFSVVHNLSGSLAAAYWRRRLR